ncbi:hypothetical protein EX30DRAFT_331845 [Ascodesmis nigricans]|uniref:DNA excision repair protein n=1 Tax=Ascodesmis nigricans TaxID=341454 RepID=A0A4S2MVM4_9PEZI|nr:hypothetical protein EX30DRAFT_331845 [Ascodesmis nigricans]
MNDYDLDTESDPADFLDDLDNDPPLSKNPQPSKRVADRSGTTTASDDEDTSEKLKTTNVRTEKVKRRTSNTANRPAKHKRFNNTIIGKRVDRKRPDRIWRFDDEDVEDESKKKKQPLPEYLTDRKRKFIQAKRDLEENKDVTSVLCVPPDYKDLEFSDDEQLGSLEEKPQISVETSAPYKDIKLEESLGLIPAAIAQYLRPYQVEGAQFLHRNFVFQDGCILGDDMGLGKTIQVIAFLTAAFGKTGDERDEKRMRKIRQWRRRTGQKRWYPKALIICPSSLINNWMQELNKWGWWHIYKYHGTVDEKSSAINAARSDNLEIMITNYHTYRINADEINTIHWDCVIADECHQIKERKAAVTQAMNDINALCRIGLTGTAIQNKYEELWTLLNWCRPGEIGSLQDWEKTISTPLKLGQAHNASIRQIGHARKVAQMLVEKLLPQMFLRRMKTLIAHQLPKKTDKVVFCPLTDLQREAYEVFLGGSMVKMIRDGEQRCDCGSGKKRRVCHYKTDSRGRTPQELVFPAILWMQKLSNHLANWIPTKDEPADVRADKLEILEECLPDDYKKLVGRERLLNYMDPQMCGKWVVLKKLLEFWFHNGDKVLIFSYSLFLLNILKELFKKTAYNVCYLDGSMKLEDRAAMVDNFNHDPDQFVFLISTKAGGVGLNITTANKIVIFDPNWNPSFDLQAQDRAYRIGQTRDVEVFRLVSSGTIEEIVYARQIYKQQQANIGYEASTERRYFTGVMDDDKNKGELFGLKNLFSFQENTILQDIVNKTNIAEQKAGVMVVGMESQLDDDDAAGIDGDEDGSQALAQLTKIALGESDTKKPQPVKENPVAGILSKAGVSYTHDNSEVIGSSKIESRISKWAIRSGESLGDQPVFVGDESKQFNTRFNPPIDVRKRQFVTMANMFGFDDAKEFALVVEGWTRGQRERMLEQFYLALLQDQAEVERNIRNEEETAGMAKVESTVKDEPSEKASVKTDEEQKRGVIKHEVIELSDDEL